MLYQIDPIPHMEYQRLLGGFIPGLIDPTCGRYCLKSLLKYWHQKKEGGIRPTRLTIQKPISRLHDWMQFDPYDDYPEASDLLEEVLENLPQSQDSWKQLLMAKGPIILFGEGVGTASWFVGHYILLVGVDEESVEKAFYYLDPLVGNDIKTAAWLPMQNRIDRIVYAKEDINTKLNRGHRYFVVPQQ